MKTNEPRSLYEVDFYSWTRETARLLRSGRFDEIDRDALAEEVEDLDKSEKRALASRFKHLHAICSNGPSLGNPVMKIAGRPPSKIRGLKSKSFFPRTRGSSPRGTKSLRQPTGEGFCWRLRNPISPKACSLTPVHGRSRRLCPPNSSRRINELPRKGCPFSQSRESVFFEGVGEEPERRRGGERFPKAGP